MKKRWIIRNCHEVFFSVWNVRSSLLGWENYCAFEFQIITKNESIGYFQSICNCS